MMWLTLLLALLSFNVNRLEQADPEGGLKLGSILFSKQPFLLRSLAMPYPV